MIAVDFKKLERPFLIGEIGINHNGDLQIAKKLIDAVFACGWDCAKFQKRNPDVCVPEHQKVVRKVTPWGEMSYLEYRYRIEFGKEEYDYIDRYSREKPQPWTMSVWDMDSLEFALQYELPFLKIPSAMLTFDKLLVEAAKSGFSILLSTGMSTIEEIDHAVNLLEKYARSYAIMHCNSSYPANEAELNLRVIQLFKERYDCVVGYSGHEYGLEPTVIAVQLGAQIVERHIALDHQMWGTDQSSSVTIMGMDELIKRINKIELVLGDARKKITEGEVPVREKLRKEM